MTKFRVREIHDGYGDSITILDDNGNPIMRMWNALDSDGAKRACDALNAYEDAARILAQRDRLAELLRRLVDDAHCDGPWSDSYCSTFNKIHEALAELDKEKP